MCCIKYTQLWPSMLLATTLLEKEKKKKILFLVQGNCRFSRFTCLLFCPASRLQCQHCRQCCTLTSCHLVSSSFSWLCMFCSFSWRALLWGWDTASSSHLMSNMLTLLNDEGVTRRAALFASLCSLNFLRAKATWGCYSRIRHLHRYEAPKSSSPLKGPVSSHMTSTQHFRHYTPQFSLVFISQQHLYFSLRSEALPPTLHQ